MSSSLSNVRVVCVRPLYGGNIGSICRAMCNTGLRNLVLVNPNPNFDKVELRKMAMRSLPIYQERMEVSDLAEAVGDCAAVAMTSGVEGFYRDHATTPREVVPELLKIAADKPVAVVFGPEDKGMGNEELKLCTHLVRIPSHRDYPSLNLSQAAMLVCHELFLAAGEFSPPTERTPPANHQALERMYACWRETMQDIQFCQPEKVEHMMMGLRRVLSRGELTDNDVKILMGLARQSSWAAKNLPREKE